MRKEGHFQNIIIAVLAVTLLVMSVGYALYSQTLNISGETTFSRSKWDVHFDTSTYAETSTITSTTHNISNTAITYQVTLPKPGTTYSFNVNVKNFGTIDATMKKITLSGLTTEQSKFITYTVSYNGVDYTATTDNLSEALAAGSSHPVVVTVNYILPAAHTDLPDVDTTVTLTVALDYESVA